MNLNRWSLLAFIMMSAALFLSIATIARPTQAVRANDPQSTLGLLQFCKQSGNLAGHRECFYYSKWAAINGGQSSCDSYLSRGETTKWCTMRRTAAAFTILQLMVSFASWFGTIFFIMEKDYRKFCWVGTILGGIFGIISMATFLTWMSAYNKDQDYTVKFKIGGGFGIMMSAWLSSCTLGYTFNEEGFTDDFPTRV